MKYSVYSSLGCYLGKLSSVIRRTAGEHDAKMRIKEVFENTFHFFHDEINFLTH